MKAQALLHLDLQFWYVLALVLISADLLMQRKDVFSFNFPRTVFGLQRGLLDSPYLEFLAVPGKFSLA